MRYLKSKKKGQAIVEYILLLSFLSILTVGFASFMLKTVFKGGFQRLPGNIEKNKSISHSRISGQGTLEYILLMSVVVGGVLLFQKAFFRGFAQILAPRAEEMRSQANVGTAELGKPAMYDSYYKARPETKIEAK